VFLFSGLVIKDVRKGIAEHLGDGITGSLGYYSPSAANTVSEMLGELQNGLTSIGEVTVDAAEEVVEFLQDIFEDDN
jgi:hypothetical protein